MTIDAQEQDTVPDFLNMSDDDIANFDPNSLGQSEDQEPETTNTTVGNDDGSVAETAEDKAAIIAAAAALNDDDKADDAVTDQTTADQVTNAAQSEGDDATAGQDQAAADAGTTAKDEKVTDTSATEANTTAVVDPAAADVTVDYEAEYKKLMGTFKANGRDITPKSAEDARALMQMGANYNKKMAGLKPSLKLLKMLETNGLLDESQLGFLIDVHKRDPAAINKLIVDSKIDPLDLSADKASEYQPGNHSVNPQAMELDEVLEEIKDSATYHQTLQVVGSDWDETSRSEVVNHPQVLKLINGHIESGIFSIIQAEMESERTFGRLKGLSDIAAYQKVGDAINARGGFNHLNLGSTQAQGKPAPVVPVVVTPKPAEVEDDKLKDRRRAASGTKAAVPNKGVPTDFNPLQMSDADFAKFQI